ncbi:subclass B3 metallo-beta-lactamase [Arcticibacter sp.]|uniref:subclass B3 metallo-beta-lactamase n=1 Tax=Arcticibacter sp. TaxID=1872630 RepID=UPI00388E9F73
MSKSATKIIALLLVFSCLSFLAAAQTVHEPQNNPPEWSKPYPPFRIAGNLYYVGTDDLACYLVVTPKGHILINTGLASSASMIKTSVEALGFKLQDIKILLTTQAHFDHMGAMAALKKMTGAKVMVNERDAAVMEDGGQSDYALGGAVSSYQPLKPDRLLHDGDTIVLGDSRLVMLHHPGHTKGSCSYLFDVKDKQRAYRVLIANMPTIVTQKNFSDIPAYPQVAEDFAYTLSAMKRLSFDIWLATHASQFGLHQKHKPGSGYNPAAFIDRKGYDMALPELQGQYDKKVAKPNLTPELSTK